MWIYMLAILLGIAFLSFLAIILQSPVIVLILTIVLMVGCVIVKKKIKLKKLYAFLLFILIFVISNVALICSRPNKDVSLGGAVVSGAMKFAFTKLVDVNDALFTQKETEQLWKNNDIENYEVVSLTDSKLEMLKNEQSEQMIYLVHGGAFINKLINMYRDIAYTLSQDLGQVSVASIDYRTESEAAFPAAIEDVIEGYNYLISIGYSPQNIIVLGDSAGANLSIELIFALQEMKKEIPAGLILLSPWIDMTESGDSYRDNASVDPLFSSLKNNGNGVFPKHYFEGQDLKDYKVSPVFGDFEGFPRTLIQVGSYEILLSDSEILYEKCMNEGVDAKLTIYNGMFHTFQIICGKNISESKQAWEEIERFIRQSLETEQ